MPQPLKAVAVNIITGFLGVGKTTAIQHLLRHKPDDEVWAVLVNEFGEVGIDGALLRGQHSDRDTLFIREIPGGCLCCSAGIPLQVALNQLLHKARPQRLIIEPTGLGHPEQILKMLSSDPYHSILDLRATLTLTTAQQLEDPKYREHPVFQQQLHAADRIIINKMDLCTEEQRQQLPHEMDDRPVEAVTQGQLSLAWLDCPSRYRQDARALPSTGSADSRTSVPALPVLDLPQTLPECGYLRLDNQGDGYFSSGWQFDPSFVFQSERLFLLLSNTPVERLKAVMITREGVFAFNKHGGSLHISELDDAFDSRIELIDDQPIDSRAFQTQLLALTGR